MKLPKKYAVLFLLLVFVLLLRLYNLVSIPVFVDEAIYIRWSQVMAAVPSLRFLPLTDGKQPLFMWMLMLFVGKFSDPLVAGRLISAFSGVGTAIGIYSLSSLLFRSRKAAVLALLIWAVSPFALFFDRLALVDSLLTALGVWTYYFAVLAMKNGKLKYAVVSGFILGLAMLTKSPALFMLILVPTTWLVADKNIKLKKAGIITVIIAVIGYAMYNILRLDPNFHIMALRNFDYVYPYSHILSSPFDPLKGHLGGIWNYFLTFAPLGLFLLAVISLIANAKKYPREMLFLSILAIVPIFVIAEYSKVVTARYLLFVLPFWVVLAGGSAFGKTKTAKVLAVLAIIMFFGHSLYIDSKLLTDVYNAPLPQGERSGYLEEWTAGQGIKEISEYIKEQTSDLPAGRQVVVGTEGYFGTLPDGLMMYLEGVPNVVTIGVGLGINELPVSLMESKTAGNKTYLVINKSRLAGSPEGLGLKLIAAYPKGLRTVGSREYNFDGPQEVLYFFEVDEIK